MPCEYFFKVPVLNEVSPGEHSVWTFTAASKRQVIAKPLQIGRHYFIILVKCNDLQ